MQKKHPRMGDSRGKGLMIGVELVADKNNRAPAAQLLDRLLARSFDHGLLLLGCGESTLRFMPALFAPREAVDQGLMVFERALGSLEEEMGYGQTDLRLSICRRGSGCCPATFENGLTGAARECYAPAGRGFWSAPPDSARYLSYR